MPFSFQRAPQAFFAQPRPYSHAANEHNEVAAHRREPAQPQEGLRLFPLMPGTGERNKIHLRQSNYINGARSVQPLRAPRQSPIRPLLPVMPPGVGPVPPEKAAEQFRRINQSLPDGVRYEPLDDETMRLLRDNGHLPKLPPLQTTPQKPAVPSQNHPAAHAAPPSPQPGNTPPLAKIPMQSSPRTPMIPPEAATLTTPPPPPAAVPAPEEIPPEPVMPKLPPEIADIVEGLAQDERNAQIFYSHVSQNAPTDTTKKSLASLAKDCESRLSQYTSLLSDIFGRNFIPEEKDINIHLEFPEAVSLAISEENNALITLGDLLDQVADTEAERPVQRVINKKVIAHQILMGLTQ